MIKSKTRTKMTDKGYKLVQKAISETSDISHINIGILSKDGGETPPGSDLNLAGIAAVNEFGTKKAGKNHTTVIPERSFIRSTMEEKRDSFSNMTGKALLRILDSSDPMKEFGLIGLAIASAIKRKITTGPFEPNAKSTIKAKGSSKPLIDTGRMRASINYEIVRKDKK